MPQRKIVFANNEIYHVYNRSVGRIPIFGGKRGYQRFLEITEYYINTNTPTRFSVFQNLNCDIKSNYLKEMEKQKSFLVEIFSFAFMPNHIHFLLRQVKEKGISDFMRKIQNSYARYLNTKSNRAGAVFQALFKAIRIETTEQLLHVSRYIHLNPVSSFLISIEQLPNYPWTSFLDYLGLRKQSFVKTDLIMENFDSVKKYEEFIYDQADYQRELEKIKHLTFE